MQVGQEEVPKPLTSSRTRVTSWAPDRGRTILISSWQLGSLTCSSSRLIWVWRSYLSPLTYCISKFLE